MNGQLGQPLHRWERRTSGGCMKGGGEAYPAFSTLITADVVVDKLGSLSLSLSL